MHNKCLMYRLEKNLQEIKFVIHGRRLKLKNTNIYCVTLFFKGLYKTKITVQIRGSYLNLDCNLSWLMVNK